MKKYYVYIIECEVWKYNRAFKEYVFDEIIYYTGFTDNPKRRLDEHKKGIRSRWMMGNNVKPLHIVYMEEKESIYSAKKREYKIKRFSKPKKLKLIEDYNQLR